MNFYSIPTFLGAIFSFILGFLILLKNKKSEQNISFFLMCLTVFLWLFSYTLVYSTKNDKIAIIFAKVACTAVIFLPITFYHFIIVFLNYKKEKIFVWLFYFLGLIFLYGFVFTRYFLVGVYKYYWSHYSKAGLLHPIFLVFFFLLFVKGLILLFKALRYNKNLSALAREQIKYILAGLIIIGFGSIYFIPKYGVEFYPFGFLFILIFILITFYAIIKYNLLDIKIVVTRAGIFISIYSLVVGISFLIGFISKSWVLSTPLAIAFASIAP
ncbi:MAG: hypothetical protein NC918_08065 [Candidatus Omnitrophica bacterium]|nr:hypothetical protein [Candidatus Omnitrophota bacterium]